MLETEIIKGVENISTNSLYIIFNDHYKYNKGEEVVFSDNKNKTFSINGNEYNNNAILYLKKEKNKHLEKLKCLHIPASVSYIICNN